MADQSAALAGFGVLVYHPGNPQFPTLPGIGDPTLGKISDWGLGADTPFTRRQLPIVPAPGQGAAKAVGFADWYLNQIWVTPTPIDFGDIADDKDVALNFYNTFRGPRTLNTVDIPVAGVELIGAASPALPDTLNSFGDKILTFRASQSGPQTFDDDITFTFDNISFEIRTLGRRVLLLFAIPEVGTLEQLGFKTDLMRAKNGIEQAFSLRKAPRSTIRYRFRFPASNDAKRTEIETILFAGTPVLPIGVQYWFEARKITTAALSTALTVQIDTTNLSISIGETFVFTTPANANVLGTIESFTGSSITFENAVGTALPVDTYGMPVRFGHMAAPVRTTVARKNLADLDVTLITEAETDIAEVDPAFFDLHPFESPGRPILKQRCLIGTISGTISREEERLDSETGRIHVTGTEALGEQSTQAVVFISSMAELHAWRKFLHHVRGSWGTFYAPTFQNDLPLFAPITLGSNEFTIPEMGIATLIGVAAPKRDLRIMLADGSIEYKRITGIISSGTGFETVTVDSVIGSGSPSFSAIADTVISWMHLVRIAGDTATFNHRMLGEADLSFRVRTAKE